MFRLLEEFREAEGHCNVPVRYKKNPGLGRWVDNQRCLYQKGKLEPEREKRLNELGFCWDPQEEAWEEMFGQLVEFNKKTGHCNVPRGYDDNPERLQRW